MKFKEVVRAAGFNPAEYPKASNYDIKVIDIKNRVILDDHLHFAHKLFVNNNDSYKKFQNLLEKLNKIPYPITTFTVKIDTGIVHVVLDSQGISGKYFFAR